MYRLSFIVILCYVAALAHTSDNRRCMSNTTAERPAIGKVAIGITGVSRGVQYTLPSIEKHIFKVLERNNILYDVYWSTVSNPYFNDRKMDDYELKLVEPCLFSIEPQEVIKHLQWNKFCQVRGYTCQDGLIRNVANKIYSPGAPMYTRMDRRHFGKYITPRLNQLKNYFCGFDSQSRLGKMIRAHSEVNNIKYDAILVIRPDVAFFLDIDLPQNLQNIKSHSSFIWVPDFQHFDGLNDRAAFGSQEVMLKYLERGDVFMTNNSYHFDIAENYLAKYVKNTGMEVQKSSMRFVRVRPFAINRVEVGIIDGFDADPAYLNLKSSEEADLYRCIGRNTIELVGNIIAYNNYGSVKKTLQNQVKRLQPQKC